LLQGEIFRRVVIFAADVVDYARRMNKDGTGVTEPDKSTNFIVIKLNLLENLPQVVHITKVFTTVPQGHRVYQAE